MAQMLSIRGDCSKLHDPLNLLLKASRKLTAEIRESKHVYLYTNDVCKKKARRYRVQGVLSFTCGLIWWTVRVYRNQVCVSRGSESNLRCRPREVSPRNEAEICPDNTTLHAHIHRHTQPFNSPVSGTTQWWCSTGMVICPRWSSSWSGAYYFILHAFLHPIIIFFLQHVPMQSQPVLL